MGKGVGGGSLINGKYWTRGGSSDFDAWVALGNPDWGWDDLLPYFKKVMSQGYSFGQKRLTRLLQAENYTDDVDADFSHELYIHPSPFTHGTNGYVHVSYPRYFYNQSRMLCQSHSRKLLLEQDFALYTFVNR